MGVEVTSLAIQVYGGMGYIEESGVPQHFRDARITADLRGHQRHPGHGPRRPQAARCGPAAWSRTTSSMIAVARRRRSRRPATTWPSIRSNLAEALDRAGRHHRLAAAATGSSDPRDALAGATPYLRMFSLVTGGWVMARQALAAKADHRRRHRRRSRRLEAKIVTARFFAEQLLPAVKGLQSPVTAGSGRPVRASTPPSWRADAAHRPSAARCLASIPSPARTRSRSGRSTCAPTG